VKTEEVKSCIFNNPLLEILVIYPESSITKLNLSSMPNCQLLLG